MTSLINGPIKHSVGVVKIYLMIKRKRNIKYRCLLNSNAPFPDISSIGLTFDFYPLTTDLNIDRGHLLIKDYLPSKL